MIYRVKVISTGLVQVNGGKFSIVKIHRFKKRANQTCKNFRKEGFQCIVWTMGKNQHAVLRKKRPKKKRMEILRMR